MVFETDIFGSCNNALLLCVARWANNVTEGMFWTLVLMGFCIILFLASVLRFGNNRAFGFAAVSGALGAFMLRITGLIPDWVSVIFILIGAIGIMAMFMSER